MIIFWALVIVVAFLLSKTEIQIENGDGYAKNLPVTWRTDNKWIRLFLAGTSYHLYMGLFLLALVHLPFVMNAWSLQSEMLVLSFLAFVTVLEDFLWFIFNPAKDKGGKRIYGVQNFKQERIPWFKDHWFVCCPIWYWWYLPLAFILYYFGQQGG